VLIHGVLLLDPSLEHPLEVIDCEPLVEISPSALSVISLPSFRWKKHLEKMSELPDATGSGESDSEDHDLASHVAVLKQTISLNTCVL